MTSTDGPKSKVFVLQRLRNTGSAWNTTRIGFSAAAAITPRRTATASALGPTAPCSTPPSSPGWASPWTTQTLQCNIPQASAGWMTDPRRSNCSLSASWSARNGLTKLCIDKKSGTFHYLPSTEKLRMLDRLLPEMRDIMSYSSFRWQRKAFFHTIFSDLEPKGCEIANASTSVPFLFPSRFDSVSWPTFLVKCRSMTFIGTKIKWKINEKGPSVCKYHKIFTGKCPELPCSCVFAHETTFNTQTFDTWPFPKGHQSLRLPVSSAFGAVNWVEDHAVRRWTFSMRF